MHHDLSFLDPGRPWLPPEDAERMERYEANRALYEGDHDKVFGQWYRMLRQDIKASLEIVVNFPGRVSDKWASLLVGDAPTIALPDDRKGDEKAKARLADLKNRGLVEAFRECVLDMSRFGDGLLKARLDEDGETVEAVSPELWFPVVSRANVREVTHHVLAWMLEEKGTGIFDRVAETTGLSDGKRKYLYAEIHSKNRVEYRLHHVEGTRIAGEASDDDKGRLFGEWVDVETHTAGMLVVHVPNARSTNRLYGYDHYKRIEGITMAFEVRTAQLDQINELHGFPIMGGPPIEPPSEEEERLRVETGERYISTMPDSEGRTTLPGYIQRDINDASIENQLNRLEKWWYILSNTSPTAYGVSETGYAESGTSLALRMVAEKEGSSVMRLFLDPGAKEAIRAATALGGDEIRDADVGWRDGLPVDRNEQAERWSKLVAAKLASHKRAIMDLYDLSEEEAEEEMRRIDEEAEAAQVAPGLTNGALGRTRQLLEGALTNGQDANGNGTPPENGPARAAE